MSRSRRIQINADNIEQNPWIIEFFKSQQSDGIQTWKANKIYYFGDKTFSFTQPIIARLRTKEKPGCAYEMINMDNCLGAGAYGKVYAVAKTISQHEGGEYRVRNKNRIVKFQAFASAEYEYERAKLTTHLHVKPVTKNGCMVMQRKAGITLYKYCQENQLTDRQAYDLMKAVSVAVKQQLADLHLKHRDLHRGNILVNAIKSGDKTVYEVNIIDYGWARKEDNFDATQPNPDLKDYFYNFESNRNLPLAIRALRAYRPLNEIVALFEKYPLAPTNNTQAQLEKYFDYLAEINKVANALANELRQKMLDALDLATANNFNSINVEIKNARIRMKACEYNNIPDFPDVLVTANEKQQTIYNQITDYYKLLEKKAHKLIVQGEAQAGKQILELTSELREHTLDAVYLDNDQQTEAFKRCSRLCQHALNINQQALKVRNNKHYIFKEIGIILSCLIVLYPIAAGIHFLATGHFSFFGQTKAEKGADQLTRKLNRLAIS